MNDINGDRNDAKRLFLRSMNSERTIKKYTQGKKQFNIKDDFFKRLDEEFKQLAIAEKKAHQQKQDQSQEN